MLFRFSVNFFRTFRTPNNSFCGHSVGRCWVHCISNSFGLCGMRFVWLAMVMVGWRFVYTYIYINAWESFFSGIHCTHIRYFLSLKLKSKRYEMVFTDDRNPNYATRNWGQKMKSNSSKYASKMRTTEQKEGKNEWATENGIESSYSNAYDCNNNNKLMTYNDTDVHMYTYIHIWHTYEHNTKMF